MTFKGARSMCPKFREIISQRNRKIQIFKWTYSCRLAKVSWTQIKSRSQKTNCWNNVQVSSNVKAKPGPFYFWNHLYVGKSRIRHTTTLNLNDPILDSILSRSRSSITERFYVGSGSFRHWFQKEIGLGLNYRYKSYHFFFDIHFILVGQLDWKNRQKFLTLIQC